MLSKTAAALRRNHYQVSSFESKEAAANYICDLFHAELIGFGDSMTLEQLDLYNRLSKENTVVDPSRSQDNDEFLQIAKECLTTTYFFTSVNALTEDGILINLDGTGNRIAGSLFGHKKVFFVVGRNKITPNIEAAVQRVRNTAAPRNAKRLGLETPCAVSGDRCYNCSSPDRICNGLMIQLKKMNDMEAEVILINEDLGL